MIFKSAVRVYNIIQPQRLGNKLLLMFRREIYFSGFFVKSFTNYPIVHVMGLLGRIFYLPKSVFFFTIITLHKLSLMLFKNRLLNLNSYNADARDMFFVIRFQSRLVFPTLCTRLKYDLRYFYLFFRQISFD